MTTKHGLGRGLKALIRDEDPVATGTDATETGDAGVLTIPLDRLTRSTVQPRQVFPDEGMEDLARSVKERGVVQPILVRKKGEGYEIIAGERRYRAAREAQLVAIPAIVVEANDQEALVLALIENLQRENLNILEEADGYKSLSTQFGMTQEQIADRLGKARASVANAMRILELPEEVKEHIRQNRISAGHAKVLLSIEIPAERLLMAKQIVKQGLSVRELESLVEKMKRGPRKRRASRDDIPDVHVERIQDLFRKRLGTSVRVASCRTMANGKKTKGCVEIDFFSSEDLDRILDVLGISDQEMK